MKKSIEIKKTKIKITIDIKLNNFLCFSEIKKKNIDNDKNKRKIVNKANKIGIEIKCANLF